MGALNPWQIPRQLAYLLGLATLPDAPNAPILTTCVVSEDLEGNFLSAGGLPANFLPDGPPGLVPPYGRVEAMHDGVLEPDMPGRYYEARFRVWVTVGKGGVAQDPGGVATNPPAVGGLPVQTHGTDALEGAPLGASGQGGTAGQGLELLVQRLIQRALNDGAAMTDSALSVQGYVERLERVDAIDGVEVVSRPFVVVVTNAIVDPYYHGVRGAGGTAPAAGSTTLSWTNPAARFDSLPNFPLVVKKAGGTPPANPTDGAVVPVTGRVQTVTDTNPPGTWSYAIFGNYDESMPGPPVTANRWSSPATFSLTF